MTEAPVRHRKDPWQIADFFLVSHKRMLPHNQGLPAVFSASGDAEIVSYLTPKLFFLIISSCNHCAYTL